MVPEARLTPPQIAILTGPTSTGKTSLALELATSISRSVSKSSDIEIINADSLLVFRGMDIGTAKPSREELARVPHHLIDIRNPDEPFTAGDFRREAEAAIAEIIGRGRRALIVGGTGFYLKALLNGLWDAPKGDAGLRAELEALGDEKLFAELERRDAASALRIGPRDHYRLIRASELIRLSGKSPSELEAEQALRPPDPRFTLWIIDRATEELFPRVETRARAMIEQGLVEETRSLLTRFRGARPLDAVGYRETVAFLDGKKPASRKLRDGPNGLIDEIALATRQLVKRQRTWFRGQMKTARWFELDRERDALVQAWQEVYTPHQ
jgi:tRNA dimethylallyltransferase